MTYIIKYKCFTIHVAPRWEGIDTNHQVIAFFTEFPHNPTLLALTVSYHFYDVPTAISAAIKLLKKI